MQIVFERLVNFPFKALGRGARERDLAPLLARSRHLTHTKRAGLGLGLFTRSLICVSRSVRAHR